MRAKLVSLSFLLWGEPGGVQLQGGGQRLPPSLSLSLCCRVHSRPQSGERRQDARLAAFARSQSMSEWMLSPMLVML